MTDGLSSGSDEDERVEALRREHPHLLEASVLHVPLAVGNMYPSLAREARKVYDYVRDLDETRCHAWHTQ